MNELALFLSGILIGGAGVYLAMCKRQSRKPEGVAAHVEKQHNEKQSRKERILELLKEKRSVTNNDVETALGVSDATATNYLQELEREGRIEQIGERGRFVSYRYINR